VSATNKVHAACRIDDAALCGAKRKYPDARTRLGIAGLAHLTDCKTCARIITVDHDAALSMQRTAKASRARHLNALRRKADEYAAGLRELGYTVIAPGEAKHRARITLSDPFMCVVCGESPTNSTYHDGVAS
jgi:hypothetical protein